MSGLLIALVCASIAAQDGSAPPTDPEILEALRSEDAAAVASAVPLAVTRIRAIYDTLPSSGHVDGEIANRIGDLAAHLIALPAGPWSNEIRECEPIEMWRDLARRNGGPRLEGLMLNSVCRLLLEQNRLDEVDAVLLDAIGGWGDHPVPRAQAQVMLADISRKRTDWPSCEDWLTAATRALDATSDTDVEARAVRCTLLGVRAQMQVEQGLVDAAWESLSRAAEIASGLPDMPFLAQETMVRRADLLLLAERYEEVVAMVTPALADSTFDPGLRGMLLVNLGIAHMEIELRDPTAPREATDWLLAARAEAHGALYLLAIEFSLAEISIREQRFSDAEQHLTRADDLLSRWNDEHELQRPPEIAFSTALRGRLERRRGADRRRLAEVLERLEDDVRLMLSSFARMPMRPGGVGFLKNRRWRRVLGELTWLRVEVEADGARKALVDLCEAQALGTLSRHLDVPAPGWDEIREWLTDSGGGCLVFLAAGQESHLFAADGEQVTHHPMPAEFEMQSLMRTLDQLVRSVPEAGAIAPIHAAADELAAALLPDSLRARIADWGHIYLIGHELFAAPIEVLPFDGDRPLGLSRAISRVPSIPLGVHLARRSLDESDTAASRPDPRVDLALLAAPVHPPSVTGRWPALHPLTLEPGDRTRLTGAFDADRVVVHVGEHATLDNLRAISNATRVLTLLCHGAYDPARERAAGLILAPCRDHAGGVIWCEDVEGIAVRGLTILSACGAARGPQRLGDDGVQHLGGAFLRAGAHTVVLSTSELGYRSTVDLVGVLLREVSRGDSTATAMMKARRAIASTPGREHPFFHSQLRVFGAGHRPAMPPIAARSPGTTTTSSPPGTPLAWWIGLTGIGAIVIAWRRRA